MKRNRIVVGDLNNPLYVFENDQLRQVDVVLRSSFSGDELAYDQLNAATFAGENGNALTIPDGTPVRYYVNDVLVGKFFAQPTTRENRIVYNISAISAIGMLSKQTHRGGLYNAVPFSQIANEIVNGLFDFSCSGDVEAMSVSGWLPYTKDARENLHQLLFAYGVMVYKDENGDIYFDFAATNFHKAIDEDKTYVDGSATPVDPITLVRVTEHSFFQTSNDLEYTLFDNSGGVTADHQLVLFSNAPIYDIVATAGVTIHESGVNYAVISGNGTLTGKAYTHTKEALTDGVDGGNVLEVTDQTMVNQQNSISVAKKLLNYYGATEQVDVDILLDGEKAGNLVEVTNPYKERVRAYIKEMTITGLATVRARCSMLANFTPTKGGNNFNNYVLLTQSGSWTVPEGVTKIRVVVGQGGTGGNGGENGEPGQRGATSGEVMPGAGGAPGAGGVAGKLFIANIDVSPGSVYNVNIGAGGAGGAVGEHGTVGGETTFGPYSSENGVVPENGYYDSFAQDYYCARGEDGFRGGDGGSYKNSQYVAGSVTDGGQTWAGGQPGETVVARGWTVEYRAYGVGGGGGGAAYGAPGANGTDGDYDLDLPQGNIGASNTYGGDGGAGGNAQIKNVVPKPGAGGVGGNGGGGGGAGGNAEGAWRAPSFQPARWGRNDPGNGGAGGLGAPGGDGGTGFVIILF